MRMISRLFGVVLFAALLSITCLLAFAAPSDAPATTMPTVLDQADLPIGGFVTDGLAVNVTGQNAFSPSLAIAPASTEPWVAFAQNNRILVAKFNPTTTTWVQQNGVLNLGSGNVAGNPSLALAGSNQEVPWAAWRESIAGVQQIVAAWFNGTNWNSTGILNRSAQRQADQPVLAVGSLVTTTEPLPWAAWAEADSAGVRQVVVSRASVDAGATGGYRWETVGGALNIDGQRNASQPDLTFAGPDHTQPWVVWTESGSDRPSRIFARRGIEASGVISWATIGRQEACASVEAACALNNNANRPAQTPQLAAGTLPDQTTPAPWIVFAETGTNGQGEIRVLRLDDGNTPESTADDRFIPVGGAVNSQCLGRDNISGQGGAQPDLYFVGNVPHVAWVETLNGVDQLRICHLADARPGQERWDLDTYTGLNRTLGAAATPSLASNGSTPYIAWQEGAAASSIFVDHRHPAGPAWGRNYPPFIRTISWSRDYLAVDAQVNQALAAAIDELARGDEPITNDITFTTSCYHENGWEQIQEVQFKLSNDQHTAFLGRYVAAQNQIFIEDPNNPGIFLGPFTPGTGQVILTNYVIVNLPKMRVVDHGDSSAAVDIDWIMSFRMPTMFQDYKQQINIVYDDGQQTGFFQTGIASLDYRAFLPAISK